MELVKSAKQLARDTFNAQPFDQRKIFANPYDRLIEIEALLEKGDNLSMSYIKNRKRQLEEWLLEWAKENNLKKL